MISAEDLLNSNQYSLQLCARNIRGMTWYGKLLNVLSRAPEAPESLHHRKIDLNKHQEPEQGNLRRELFNQSTTGGAAMNDADICELNQAVEKIHGLSLEISEVLSSQDYCLDRLNQKTTATYEKSIALTLQMTQLRVGNKICCNSLKGVYMFQVGDSFLSVDEEDNLVVSPVNNFPGLESQFNCFSDDDEIVTIQSKKSLKYLGVNVFGNISCKSLQRSCYEYCYVDLNGTLSGICLLACNWGCGGWLKHNKKNIVGSVSRSLSERDDIIYVRAVLCN